MGATWVAASFLSSFLSVLFNKIASEAFDFFKSLMLNEGLLRSLKTNLMSASKLLDDAEEKQITNPLVKEWLDELKDVVYEADDLLDEIAYEARRSELKSDDSHAAGTHKERKILKPFGEEMDLIERLKKILERIQLLLMQKDALGLMEGGGERSGSQLERRTTCLIDESKIYGRDDDKEAIIEMLIPHEGDTRIVDGPVVISIVGMGGIGKTTLAQLVYNDNRVKTQFQLHAWICVSQEFDVFKVTRNILKELAPGDMSIDGFTPNLLHSELEKRLNGKRFLLVLDDIWDEIKGNWDTLRMPFKSGAQESRIIVTTRNQTLASFVSPTPYRLEVLSDDHCRSLFARRALGEENFSNYRELEEIGKQIVKKCKGLPLVANTLGGLLNNERDARKWERILKSNIWDVKNDSILPALRLSYHYLPSSLNRCFAYCAIIPKDCPFKKEKLVLFWMAEGLLVEHEQNMQMEEIGGEYFDDLVARSFFQQYGDDSSSFVMHDLINDLAKYVSGDFCYRVESNNSSRMPKKIRHLSYERRGYVTSKEFNSIYEAQQLRTLVPNDAFQRSDRQCIRTEAIQGLLSLKQLRVLSLSWYYNIIELPEFIGKLKHLRYLDLSWTGIKELPNVVSNAYNLQTLDLEGCTNLRELPDIIALKQLHYLNLGWTQISKWPNDMGSLVNLYFLNLRGTDLQHMPLEFGNLTNLQTLTDFFVKDQSGSGIKELKGLHNLKGVLSIRNLQNVPDAKDALEANMKNKKYLETLKLSWQGDTNDSLHDKRVLKALQPHPSLQHLSITGYGGTSFPYWIGDYSFSKMVSLTLEGCKYCCELPPLGQMEFLKKLKIIQFDQVIIVGPSFYGNSATKKPFESLEILVFEQMSHWQTWKVKEDTFHRLQVLRIRDCSSLKEALPSCLPSLTRLEIKNCPQISTPFLSAPQLKGLILEDTFFSRNLLVHDGMLDIDIEWDSLDEVLGEIEQMGVILTNLKGMLITHCGSISRFPIESLPMLGFLKIKDSPDLKSLPSLPPSLQQLQLDNCPQLESFAEEGLPPKLQSLEIWWCEKLIANRMQWKLQLLPSLSQLKIGGRRNDERGSINGNREDRMELFPEEMNVPSTLVFLAIRDFENLESLQCEVLRQLSSLERLRIQNCPKLLSVPEYGLPSTITSLTICEFKNLKSLNYKAFNTSLALKN